MIRLAQKYPGYKIVVLDKLDYCASLRNLESVIRLPNVKARPLSPPCCSASPSERSSS